jgi:hypothetical protein
MAGFSGFTKLKYKKTKKSPPKRGFCSITGGIYAMPEN